MSAKKKYEEDARSQLEAWDIHIEKLKADIEEAQLKELHAQVDGKKAKSALSDAQIEHYKQELLKELREKREYAEDRLEEIKLANEQHWEHLKGDAEKVWNELADAIDVISSKVGGLGYDVKGAALDVVEYSFEEQEKATAQVKELMSKMGSAIEVLEDKANKEWEGMNEGVRKARAEIIKTLKQKHSDVSKWYTSFKHSSEKGWNDVNKGFSKAYRDISDAFKKAKKEFEKH